MVDLVDTFRNILEKVVDPNNDEKKMLEIAKFGEVVIGINLEYPKITISQIQ